MRKIYIGKSYITKQGKIFIVDKIEKGNLIYKNQHIKGRSERRAIDVDGNRIKISNLLNK